MYTKRKLFIFHNEKVVTHIESQPNQSRYIESLILNDLKPKQEIDIISLLQQYISPNPKNEEIQIEKSNDISLSISNILNLV